MSFALLCTNFFCFLPKEKWNILLIVQVKDKIETLVNYHKVKFGRSFRSRFENLVIAITRKNGIKLNFGRSGKGISVSRRILLFEFNGHLRSSGVNVWTPCNYSHSIWWKHFVNFVHKVNTRNLPILICGSIEVKGHSTT